MSTTALQHLQQQRMLLEMEYAVEKEAFRRQTELIGVERKVKSGDAWYPITIGRSYYNSLNQLQLEVFRHAGDDSDHNFEYGKPLSFFRGDPLKYYGFSATVAFVDGNRMVVTIPDNAPVTELQTMTESIGCQLSFDETSYRAMFDAIDRVMRARDNRLAELRELWWSATPLKCSAATLPPATLSALNASQQHAVESVVRARDVAIVHGPPGTGKTTTLVEAIYETLRREPQVLVCAQSNMAVDWISEKLVDRGLNVLRLGNPSRVDDKMLSFTYERRFESHPDYPLLWSLRKAMRELRAQRKNFRGTYHQKMDRLRGRATELEVRINGDIFRQAHVVASTLVGADSRLLMGMTFNTLFVDEAAQALEAATWIAIRRARRVVLAGDHCQLPPTVKSIAALKGGLSTTLMERLVKRHPECVTLLRTQYRMNEKIMNFSNQWFYHGMVNSSPTISHRGILDYDSPMEWIDTSALADATAEQRNKSLSLTNTAEAQLTATVLESYISKIGRQRMEDEHIDIGIISPYRAQVQLLRQTIKKQQGFKPYRRFISVNTVDGFQGQERDVIIISLVRSNDSGQIGFLRDLRRMNVAMTRARMKLIIIGDAATLSRHPFYKQLYDYIQEN
jgi:hypothetical protein